MKAGRSLDRRALSFFAVTLSLGFAAATAAQTPPPSESIGGWRRMPPPSVAASTPIPLGAGAIPVPSVSGQDSEPQALLCTAATSRSRAFPTAPGRRRAGSLSGAGRQRAGVPDELEYVEATNFHETELETTVVATVGYRFLLYNMNLDLFSDFAAPGPTIDWRSTLSGWLTLELSLDYKVDLLRLRRVSDMNQVAQRLLFRYSIGS